MESELARIYNKPSDYKVCSKCRAINWYENRSCHSCHGNDFDGGEETVMGWIESEYSFYRDVEGYDRAEVDDFQVDI